MAVTTTNTDIGLAVPNVGLDTPDPEKPTRKLLYAILIDYLQGIKALETGKLSTSVIAQELGPDAGKVVSQAILTDILQNLSFAQLADTPFAYVGSAGKALRVNSAQDGIEFFSLADVATSGDYNDLINKPDLNSIPQIVTAANFAALPATGDVTKTYLTLDDGKLFFWDGSAYQNFTNETATWAGIGGQISDNSALQGELDAKANAADVALKTTSIYAGAGLTGGGDLSQDRTLNVDFGTGAGQVMAGDDARVAGLKDGAYAEVGVDVAPLDSSGKVPPAHLPPQFSGDYDDLTNKPALFSGDYDDLSGKPALGTVAALNVDTDADLAANSDALIPSQKAVKAYVDNNAGGDVTAAGDNVFTGSNTFDQPLKVPTPETESDAVNKQYADGIRTAKTWEPEFEGVLFTNAFGNAFINEEGGITLPIGTGSSNGGTSAADVELEEGGIYALYFTAAGQHGYSEIGLRGDGISNTCGLAALNGSSASYFSDGSSFAKLDTGNQTISVTENALVFTVNSGKIDVSLYVEGTLSGTLAGTTSYTMPLDGLYVRVSGALGTGTSNFLIIEEPLYPITNTVQIYPTTQKIILPENAAGNVFEVQGLEAPAMLEPIGLIDNGDWVAFGLDSVPSLINKEPEEITAARVKQLYESNPDTNAFTDADVVKLANAADKTLPINWLAVSTSTFLIEPEHAGMSLWVTVDCVITVSAHSALPNGFNCEVFKAGASLIVSVVTSGSDTIRDGKSIIVSDASVFKSPSAGVIGLVGDVS